MYQPLPKVNEAEELKGIVKEEEERSMNDREWEGLRIAVDGTPIRRRSYKAPCKNWRE